MLDHINQNRIPALLGYQVSDPFSILGGFLYQVIQRPEAAMGNELLELNTTFHIALGTIRNCGARPLRHRSVDEQAGKGEARLTGRASSLS